VKNEDAMDVDEPLSLPSPEKKVLKIKIKLKQPPA